MKAVLISIQPKWCELIANCEKTVEVRKTKPKIDVPFKCYIYETKDKKFEHIGVHYADERKDFIHHIGKVIGEFVCDRIYNITPHFDKPDFCNQYICDWKWGEGTACLSFTEMNDYLKGEKGYGWHITDLVIYEQPKALSEFYVEGDCDCMNCRNCAWFDRGNGYNVENDCNLAYKGVDEHKSYKPIKRPFQSWGYVYEADT